MPKIRSNQKDILTQGESFEIFLGMNMGMHDASICLMENDQVEIIQSERLTRIKKDGGFPIAPLELYKDELLQDNIHLSYNALGRPIAHQINYWNALYPFSKKIMRIE